MAASLGRKISQEFFWSTRNSDKYSKGSTYQTNQIESESFLNPVIILKNKLWSNILDVRAQWKGVTDEELKTRLAAFLMSDNNKAGELIEEPEPDSDGEGYPLKAKSKFGRLSSSVRLKILVSHYKGLIPRSRISETLCIPYSTVNSVIRNFENDPAATKGWFSSGFATISKSKSIRNVVNKFIQSHNKPFTSNQITRYVKELTGAEISRSEVIDYMKKNLKMSFKRVSSRPIKANSNRNMLLKSVFLLEFANIVNQEYIFVNVDEVIFSNATKWNYSWGFRSKDNTKSNIMFAGSIAVFGTITSKGDWFFSNLVKHNNSEEFIAFINKLIKWLTEDLGANSQNIVLLIDNSPIHTSGYSMKNLKELNCKVVFLSPYWPNFAPIELMFHILKKRICKHAQGETVRLCSKEGLRALRMYLRHFLMYKLSISGSR